MSDHDEDRLGLQAVSPEFRRTMIETYQQLAETERKLGHHDRAAYCLGRADALAYGGTSSLASLLDEGAV